MFLYYFLTSWQWFCGGVLFYLTGNDPVEQVTLDAIIVVYQGHGAELLELDIAA